MITFFGAALGLCSATSQPPTWRELALVLLFTAGIVVGICYASPSRQRRMYAALAVLFSWVLPRLLPDHGANAG